LVPAFLDSFGDGYKQMKHCAPIATILLGVAVASVQSQGPRAISQDANLRYSQSRIITLIESCAPGATPSTMLAVATTESSLYPYAISVNRPIQIAQAIGLANSQIQLAQQPRSRQQAIQWMRWLLGHGSPSLSVYSKSTRKTQDAFTCVRTALRAMHQYRGRQHTSRPSLRGPNTDRS